MRPGNVLRSMVQRMLRQCGYEIVRCGAGNTGPADPGLLEFKKNRKSIFKRHDSQTVETIACLNNKYREPIFGEVHVWDLLQRLAFCTDPTDSRLLNASQYLHVLQILEAMERDELDEPFWYLCAILHDLGKLLLLTPEDPANIVCMNSPVGEHQDHVGLENIIIQWNHDEFAYMKLRNIVPNELAWLIRFHSMDLKKCERYMDERDRVYRDKYLLTFRKYDFCSKSPYHLPRLDIEKYRVMVEEAFPDPIPF